MRIIRLTFNFRFSNKGYLFKAIEATVISYRFNYCKFIENYSLL